MLNCSVVWAELDPMSENTADGCEINYPLIHKTIFGNLVIFVLSVSSQKNCVSEVLASALLWRMEQQCIYEHSVVREQRKLSVFWLIMEPLNKQVENSVSCLQIPNMWKDGKQGSCWNVAAQGTRPYSAHQRVSKGTWLTKGPTSMHLPKASLQKSGWRNGKDSSRLKGLSVSFLFVCFSGLDLGLGFFLRFDSLV